MKRLLAIVIVILMLVTAGTVLYGGPFWPWTPIVMAIVAGVVLMIRGRNRT
jgi:hypothetical protein